MAPHDLKADQNLFEFQTHAQKHLNEIYADTLMQQKLIHIYPSMELQLILQYFAKSLFKFRKTFLLIIKTLLQYIRPHEATMRTLIKEKKSNFIIFSWVQFKIKRNYGETTKTANFCSKKCPNNLEK